MEEEEREYVDELNAALAEAVKQYEAEHEDCIKKAGELADLQAKLAAAEKERSEDYPLLKRRIAALEAEVARLNEELAYYCNHPDHKPARPDAVNRAYMEGASAQFEADKRNMKRRRSK